MNLIFSAAYLSICDCGAHGAIVTALGFRGPEFVSKEMAIAMLNAGVELELINKDEVPHLRLQIETCSLPERDKDAFSLAHVVSDLITQIAWNQIEAARDQEEVAH